MTRLEPMDSTDQPPEFQERRLVARLKTGDLRCMGLLEDHFGEELMDYLLAILGNQDLAEDAFQDTWVRVMEHIQQFDCGRSFSPWLFRIARNLAYDRLRRQRWKIWLRIGSGEPEDPAIDVPAPGAPRFLFALGVQEMLIIGSVLLVILFVWIGIGVFVYYDAKQRGMEPLLWALVAAFVPYLLGLIAYLVVRQPIQGTCPSCGRQFSAADVFCKHCGHAVQAQCSSCRRAMSAGARFCPSCGTGLNEAPGTQVSQ